MKEISDLIVEADTWAMIREWIRNSQLNIEILENNRTQGEEALYHLQITNRSTMGAIALESGGLIVDNGWLCILGSGHSRIYGSLVNNKHSSLFEEGFVIAYDVVGGLFAINTGQFENHSRNIYYFAPDTLEWEDTGKGYTDFINWVLNGDLNQYYETFRWDNWINDLKGLQYDQGISVFPYLWSKEGKDVEKSLKKAIPLHEIWGIQNDFRNQFNG
ncbi:uncharacterized protein DUF2625 [Paenibacillus cellulosilyticus]|uniref:Uncharacterized protein DUF2625 n=1 Tax=Paenibacillus cellulosilyticus TaxID=375489 RepID=A0A2V2YLC4_9BACL|nr:DUF2625 family protein [Paenibacillus cellulosilyticus]PWV94440.1 uncharacterized protein DUF2625 [Paenibacillus cellulosilyticus]QKS44962.1 DUF2625 family protein [Paenibacillus cellulosilyticus]